MNIIYKIGNLLNATEKAILHGVNCQGVMRSGVAKDIREKWPHAFEIYELKHKTFGLKLGTIIPVVTTDGKIIINCITQEFYGRDGKRYVDYDAVEKCFTEINKQVLDWGITEIAMPRLGAGLGGGDWNIIENIIVKASTNFIPFVYDLN